MKLFDGFSEHRIYVVSGILELLSSENILVVLQATFYTIHVPIEVLGIHLWGAFGINIAFKAIHDG